MGKCMDAQVNKLLATGNLPLPELTDFLRMRNRETAEYLFDKACEVRKKTKKNVIEIWGRIPVGSFCKYDCKICGLSRSNRFADRYRMDVKLIEACCRQFAQNGVTNFLLESGDDAYFSQNHVCEMVKLLYAHFPECKIILNLGEKTTGCYQSWKNCGVTDYLFSYGTASELHFKRIYPPNMSLLSRKQCLWQLKEIGYRVGTGFLIGTPYQNINDVLSDITFVKSFTPQTCLISAFLPALHTAFEKERSGNGDMITYLMAVLRLMLPNAHIAADATLDCVLKDGRIGALIAGADVLIADLPEENITDRYQVYERKNGRSKLPPDSVRMMQAQIKEMGLTVQS